MTHLEKCGRWERDSVLGERFSAGREIQCWERDSVLGERFSAGREIQCWERDSCREFGAVEISCVRSDLKLSPDADFFIPRIE